MDKEKVVKMQLAQLHMMKIFHNICVNNDLRYYLVAGTALGACRHSGFIPWDADMDIALPREDYDRFLTNYTHLLEPECQCLYHLNSDTYFKSHAIIVLNGATLSLDTDILNPKYKNPGIYIEIFPLDHGPKNRLMRKVHSFRLKFIKRFRSFKVGLIYPQDSGVKRLLKRMISLLLAPISLRTIGIHLDNVMKMYNNSKYRDPDVWTINCGAYSYEKESVCKNIYGIPTKVKFEDCEFYAPENLNEFLKHYYGDYMTPPSEEEQNRMYEFFSDLEFHI